MDFSNQVITTPPPESVVNLPLTRLSTRYRRLNIVISIFWTTLILIVLALLDVQPFFALPEWLDMSLNYLMCAVFVLGLVDIVHSVLSFPIMGYALREQDISFQSGLVFRKVMSQPILRIQHIELKRGPFERMENLATLQVFSAGGALHTFEIPGLDIAEAEGIRQFLLEHGDLSNDG